MSVFRRIFDMGPSRQQTPDPYVAFQNDDGTERLRMVPDTNANAVAARHNFSMIYGAQNLPAEFGMRGVIEVKDENGNWTPVTGNTRGVPDVEAQLGALQSWRETGIIGPQPVAGGDGSSNNGTRPRARQGSAASPSVPSGVSPDGGQPELSVEDAALMQQLGTVMMTRENPPLLSGILTSAVENGPTVNRARALGLSDGVSPSALTTGPAQPQTQAAPNFGQVIQPRPPAQAGTPNLLTGGNSPLAHTPGRAVQPGPLNYRPTDLDFRRTISAGNINGQRNF